MLIGIFGNLSSGKTLLGVKLLKDEYDKDSSVKIIANLQLKGMKYYKVSLDQLISLSKRDPEFFNNSLLFIDELHNVVDARRSSSALNTEYTQFITQVGKLNCTLVYTSQVFQSQIDVRIRELTDFIIFCNRVDSQGQLIISRKRIVDTPIFIQATGLIRQHGGASWVPFKFVFDPKAYFGLYNTKELVLLDRRKYLRG